MAHGIGRAGRRAKYSLSVTGSICAVFEVCDGADIAGAHVDGDCARAMGEFAIQYEADWNWAVSGDHCDG